MIDNNGMNDSVLDSILEYKRHFDSDGKKRVSTLIMKHTLDYPIEWIKKCRREYLETIIDEIRFDIIIENARMEKYHDSMDKLGIALTRDTIKELSNGLDKIDKEIYFTENPQVDISAKIGDAKSVPFGNFLEFNRYGQAICPFHGDKDPSMKLYSNNTVHCFSCHKSWDTIQFVRDLYGLTFMEALEECLR